MINPHTPRLNHLLNNLSSDEYEHFSPYLDLVPMPLGKLLYESGSKLNYAYFPTTCIVSMLYFTENGEVSEIVGVGNDGIIGADLFMSFGTMPIQAVVRSPGYAYRLREHHLLQDLDGLSEPRYETLNNLLRHYAQVLFAQMAQMVVCNRYHSVEQQLSRWLLMCLDRLSSNELTITHAMIANILGVRRESVTEAAGKLQQAKLIVYSRGHITVLDKQGLEARGCGCYQLIKRESNRLLLASALSHRHNHNGYGMSCSSLDGAITKNANIKNSIDRRVPAYN
jgi:CRP-like cAMP-binding protein